MPHRSRGILDRRWPRCIRHVQRLRALRAVAINRDRLQTLPPDFDVCLAMSSTVHSSGMLIVFEIAPEMNGCTAAIMLDVAHVVDGARAIRRPEAAIEDRQMLRLDARARLRSCRSNRCS